MLSELKPYINGIVFSPTLLLICISLGIWMAGKRLQVGRLIAMSSTGIFWILATPALSIWLSQSVLPQYPPISIDKLQAEGVQAIIVLGGGVDTGQPDGVQQLNPSALDRLRHGIELSRKTGIPILVTGGKGWGAVVGSDSEATISKRVALDAFQYQIKWTESDSRDTRENARNSKELLSKYGLNKIALVTHSWHMPRSIKAFKKEGFEVTAAPMGFVGGKTIKLISLFPSISALQINFTMLRELVASLVQGQ
jgi:uncharacterized SAM-binding protein YcdF (DUF218 family)